MWMSSDTGRRARARCRRAAVLSVILLPLAATAALRGEGAAAGGESARERLVASRAGGQQLRCWQYGRLILEENGIEAPPESAAYALRMQGGNGGRPALYLVDMNNATCLIKGPPARDKAR